MPAAGRRCDQALVENDSHGCPCCPHGTFGAAAVGSGNVSINGFASLRLGDPGSHGGCCGSTGWRAAAGWSTVLVNGLPIHCQGDATEHCGGIGALVGGSPNVIVGERSGSVFQLRISMPFFLRVTLEGFILSPQRTLDMILAFRHGPMAGFGALFGTLGQIWTRYALGQLFGLLPFGTILDGIVMIFGDYIPFISDVLRWARAGFQMIFNMLFETGVAAQNGPCPELRGVQPPKGHEVEYFTMTQDSIWDEMECQTDVTRIVLRLVTEFRPVFIQHPDDHRGLRMEELLAHSQLVPRPAGTPATLTTLAAYKDALDKAGNQKLALDIEESFGRNPGQCLESAQVYYGRAIKCSSDSIKLHYFGLRSGSFIGNSYIDQHLYEHEGDGEGVTVVVRRLGAGKPWLLAGLSFEGKHYTRNCAGASIACIKRKGEDGEETKQDDCLGCGIGRVLGDMSYVTCETDGDTNRPVVYVAIGSHALGPSAGPRRMTTCFVDYYPTEARIATYQLVTSNELDVRETVFTRRVTWGVDRPLLFTSTYGGHDEYPETSECHEAEIDAMFLPVPEVPAP